MKKYDQIIGNGDDQFYYKGKWVPKYLEYLVLNEEYELEWTTRIYSGGWKVSKKDRLMYWTGCSRNDRGGNFGASCAISFSESKDKSGKVTYRFDYGRIPNDKEKYIGTFIEEGGHGHGGYDTLEEAVDDLTLLIHFVDPHRVFPYELLKIIAE